MWVAGFLIPLGQESQTDVYKPFLLFSLISLVLSAAFIAGLCFRVRIFRSEFFFVCLLVYFCITMATFLILLFKDNRIIFAKRYVMQNLILYLLTTPAPVIAVLLLF